MNNETNDLYKKMTYKEFTAKSTIIAVGGDNTNHYLISTAAGTLICKNKFKQDDEILSNVFIVHDVSYKLNSGIVIDLPELVVFVDQIVAFEPIDEQAYQNLLNIFRQG